MNTEHDNTDKLITTAQRISEKLCTDVGIATLALNQEKVPPSIRPMLRHAAILGIGDDGTRHDIFEAVPVEYLNFVKQDISKSFELLDWYRQAETTDEKHLPEVAAIGWMLAGLNLG